MFVSSTDSLGGVTGAGRWGYVRAGQGAAFEQLAFACHEADKLEGAVGDKSAGTGAWVD